MDDVFLRCKIGQSKKNDLWCECKFSNQSDLLKSVKLKFKDSVIYIVVKPMKVCYKRYKSSNLAKMIKFCQI